MSTMNSSLSTYLMALIIIVLEGYSLPEAYASSCIEIINHSWGLRNTAEIEEKKYKTIDKKFFGFNLNWVGFQLDLWNENKKEVLRDVVKWLQDFSGAIYRYPGGIVANYFNWESSVGPIKQRSPQKAVSWRTPLVSTFGFTEYLTLVHNVGGTRWVVANLFGEFGREHSTNEIAKLNSRWAQYVKENITDYQPFIYRWELGNELDRGEFMWSAHKYAIRASAVANEIKSVLPDSEFVVPMEDYSAHQNITFSSYNREVISIIPSFIKDFSLHQYYDGTPDGLSVQNRLRHVCQVINDIKKERPGSNPSIWITEHARWPPGKASDKNWKEQWWRSVNLEAALGVADMIIGLSQIPEVRGAMLHALGSTEGPWPLFHKMTDGSLYPSSVYWALRLMRESMLERVIATHITANNKSRYKGGYDVRAVVMTDNSEERFTLWVVNRLDRDNTLFVKLPSIVTKDFSVRHTYISNPNINAANIDSNPRIVIPHSHIEDISMSSNGETILSLLPNSVSSFEIFLK